VSVSTFLVPFGKRHWIIQDEHGRRLGEIHRTSPQAFLLEPDNEPTLEAVRGEYSSQSAAMDAIIERTGGPCRMKRNG
jgi:hypothetical protein